MLNEIFEKWCLWMRLNLGESSLACEKRALNRYMCGENKAVKLVNFFTISVLTFICGFWPKIPSKCGAVWVFIHLFLWAQTFKAEANQKTLIVISKLCGEFSEMWLVLNNASSRRQRKGRLLWVSKKSWLWSRWLCVCVFFFLISFFFLVFFCFCVCGQNSQLMHPNFKPPGKIPEATNDDLTRS